MHPYFAGKPTSLILFLDSFWSIINKIYVCHDCRPFLKETTEIIMYSVAEGMDWLHNLNIIHRDLKSSNVLFSQNDEGWDCFVTDIECSVGIVGIGFFRAPEILQALKDKVVNKKSNPYTKEANVYSYQMMCYKILTEKLSYEGHCIDNYNLVLEGQQPKIPNYIDKWVHDLFSRCWQIDLIAKRIFEEIMILFEANSIEVKNSIKEARNRNRNRILKEFYRFVRLGDHYLNFEA